MLESSFSNPFRSPDWRWLRAAGYLDGEQPRPTRKRDGAAGYAWITRAARFQRRLANCENDRELTQLSEDDPAVFWAHQARQDDRDPMRWQIEAHLLARGTDWEVGHHAGVSPQVIEAYEALFYNVRERLAHKGYILHRAIGPAIQRGLSSREPDLLWKLYGYFCGPHVLLGLISNFPNPGWCSGEERIGDTIRDDTIATLMLKGNLAAKTVPVNSHTQLELLNIFTKFVEVERTTGSTGQAQSQIMDHISTMMTTLPFNVGGRDPRAGERISTGPMEKYRNTAIELSYEEALVVSAGGQLPNERQLLELGQVDEDGRAAAYPKPEEQTG